METPLLRKSCRQCVASLASRRTIQHQQRRCLATPVNNQEPVRAAAPIRFTDDKNQFVKRSRNNDGSQRARLMDRVRVVPASPSYFTATPEYTDDLLHLTALLRRHQHLPLCPPGKAPLVAWKTFQQYLAETNEPIKITRFTKLVGLIKRLNYIHTPLMPLEVANALSKFKRSLQPLMNKSRPIVIDSWGRARAVGRRKTSSAQVWLVEGDGQVLINGRSLSEFFGRIHDRESSIWALKATERVDKYNVFAIVKGGGTTGQAEAIMLGVARALLAHEPALKPAVRRAGCITRDPRRVERKKPGHLKARKMPTWVKR